jgi:hypothetical protein
LAWPRLTTPNGSYVSFNTPSSVKRAMKQHFCGFWAQTGWSVSDRVTK